LREAQRAGILFTQEADFEVFRPAGATRCTGWGEISAPIGVAQRLGYRSPKTEIFTEI